MFVQWLKSRDLIAYSRQRYFTEFFIGLKPDWKARSYMLLNYGRRTIFVLLVTFGGNAPFFALMPLFFCAQLVYAGAIIYLRPFEEVKDNAVELTNELFFVVFSGSLFYLSEEKRWSDVITKVYMWTVTANTMTVTVILTVALILQLKRNGFKCRSKDSIKVVDESQISGYHVKRPTIIKEIDFSKNVNTQSDISHAIDRSYVYNSQTVSTQEVQVGIKSKTILFL